LNQKLAIVLQLIGAALMIYGVSVIDWPFAIVLGGLFSILFGVALERRIK
jgi:hypothetical protein